MFGTGRIRAISYCYAKVYHEQQTSHQTLVSANTNLPFATPSPMAYAPYGNLYTPMHSLPTVCRFAESSYAPMAIPYPPTTTDIVSQLSTANISRTPESTLKPSEDDAAAILLNLSSQRN